MNIDDILQRRKPKWTTNTKKDLVSLIRNEKKQEIPFYNYQTDKTLMTTPCISKDSENGNKTSPESNLGVSGKVVIP